MQHRLHVVFQNVNHSPQHTHLLLERCAADDVDVVCIQEPWYGPIRPIPSASPAGPAERTEDNMLYGTQLHPAWYLIEARKDARVACHVNRRLVNAIISVDSSVNHRDCMLLCVRLDPTQDPINILNIYNDSRNTAIDYLADVAHTLPDLDIVGGDYNTHARLWDPEYPPDSAARTGEVIDLHARLGLRLLSPVGVPTHFPHRGNLRNTVIDLVWVPDDHDPDLYNVRVAPDERGLSDHAVIHAHIPAGQWSYQGSPSIAPGSEAEKQFIGALRTALHNRLPPDTPLNTPADLQEVVDTLFTCIQDAWSSHASPVVICNKSRQWWDQSCTEARCALNEARARLERIRAEHPRLLPEARAAIKAAFRRLKSTIRARRRRHMDERIQHVASEQ
ncbi:DNase I-like protein, partial [Pilatotrama ljubarskyi]